MTIAVAAAAARPAWSAEPLRVVVIPPPAKTERLAPGPSAGPFGQLGSLEFRVGTAGSVEKWRAVLGRFEAEKADYSACDRDSGACGPGLRAWRRLIGRLAGRPALERLAGLNRFVNKAARYASDEAAFGRSDRWLTPASFFEGAGDCEDFAIVKFLSLLELGFANEDLRLIVARDRRRGLVHALVSVRLGDKVYILDSLSDDVREDRSTLRYEPIYSVNLTDRWAHVVTPEIRAASARVAAGTKSADGGRARPILLAARRSEAARAQ